MGATFRKTVIAVMLFAALGIGVASGSFSLKFTPLPTLLEVTVEQAIGSVGGWTVYAGSGFAASPFEVVELQPYTIACRDTDLKVAWAEACVEARAPLIGDGSVLTFFFNLGW